MEQFNRNFELKEARHRRACVYDSIYVKLKVRQYESLVLAIRSAGWRGTQGDTGSVARAGGWSPGTGCKFTELKS